MRSSRRTFLRSASLASTAVLGGWLTSRAEATGRKKKVLFFSKASDGVVFIGAAMDERFHAFDKSTGKLLWQYQMSAGGYATPATFEAAGRQFVIIAAGGGGKPMTHSGDAYYCFALPKMAHP